MPNSILIMAIQQVAGNQCQEITPTYNPEEDSQAGLECGRLRYDEGQDRPRNPHSTRPKLATLGRTVRLHCQPVLLNMLKHVGP